MAAVTAKVAVWGIGIVAAVVGSHVRLETRFSSHVKQSNSRVLEVEKRLGLKSSNGVKTEFVTHESCEETQRTEERERARAQAEVLRSLETLRQDISELRHAMIERS